MQGRLAQLQESQLITSLTDLRRQLDAFKNRQRVSGRSGLVGYLTQTADQWDSSGTITTRSGLVTWTITFTGDGSQDYPVINPYIDLFVGNTSTRLIPSSQYVDGSGNTAQIFEAPNSLQTGTYWLLVDQSLVGDKTKWRWTTQMEVSNSVTFGSATISWWLKAHAVGTSAGTLNVTTQVQP